MSATQAGGNPVPGRAADGVVDAFAPGVRALAPVLGLDAAQVEERLDTQRRDLVDRFRNGRLGEVFARAAEVEPLIGHTRPEMARMRLVPFGYEQVAEEVGVIHACQLQAEHRRARLVIAVNTPRWDRIENRLTRALAGGHVAADDIVVVWVDRSGESRPGRYPTGVRVVDFATHAQSLAPERVSHALVMLLRSFRAEAIVNVNSRRFFEAMGPFGRALAASDRLFMCFSELRRAENGGWAGQSLRNFYRHVDFVHGVLTEDAATRERLIEQYQVPPGTAAAMTVLDPDLSPAEYADRAAAVLLGERR